MVTCYKKAIYESCNSYTIKVISENNEKIKQGQE